MTKLPIQDIICKFVWMLYLHTKCQGSRRACGTDDSEVDRWKMKPATYVFVLVSAAIFQYLKIIPTEEKMSTDQHKCINKYTECPSLETV